MPPAVRGAFSPGSPAEAPAGSQVHLVALTFGVSGVVRCGCKQTLLASGAGPARGADALGHSVDSDAFASVPASCVTRHCQHTHTHTESTPVNHRAVPAPRWMSVTLVGGRYPKCPLLIFLLTCGCSKCCMCLLFSFLEAQRGK